MSNHALRTATRARPGSRTERRPRLGERQAPYVFLLPMALLFLAFKLYPFGYSAWLSFTTGSEETYVGLDNYTRLFGDELFYQALRNTAFFVVVQVPVMLLLALVLAVALNSVLLRFRRTLRLVFFLPVVMGLVAYGILFGALFANDFGTVNALLADLGLPRVNWLGDPLTARFSVVLAMLWHYTGYFSVIFLAQLQSIPDELYDAAATDGAGTWQKFRHVTLPGLRPAVVLTTVMATAGTLQLFDEPYVLTNGGPDGATTTIGLYMYLNGFTYFDFGYASAIGWVLTAIIAVIALVQVKVLGRER
ncbi:carbohydrate ABC transporter permease [Kitasatospora purpeofusca]|uniref:carbohydrate ABC transporter permease n=1 Tax=Kitasatospora purpeofusca TaxID=67352 RepID=UPI0035E1C359